MNKVKKTATGAFDFVKDAMDEGSRIFWRFFDWVAITEWDKIHTVAFLLFVLSLPTGLTDEVIWVIIGMYALKQLAGGKRKAELQARRAEEQAGVANMERRLVEAQMATLQAQIEPHFLFNTLALIGQLIETDPKEAAKVHTHLIEYLRATMPQMRSKGGGGTLGKQVELSRAYLAIMQARMKERLAVSFDVQPHLAMMSFPPMMLLTLIENAIKHGLEPKIDGGRIDVRAYVEGAKLHVDVQDNGVGFNLHSDEGVGLANIRERLQLLYGNEAELVIEAPMEGGALASIRVPTKHPENK
jgi:sensor histidine kinase YesM